MQQATNCVRPSAVPALHQTLTATLQVAPTTLKSWKPAHKFCHAQKQQPRGIALCRASNDVALEKFPANYRQLMQQAQAATQAALTDGLKLLEIEFPTAGLDSVSGDAEGGIEMTDSMQYVQEFCGLFERNGKGSTTRIFFPDKNDMEKAQKEVFMGSPFQLDYLTKISGLEDFGLGRKVAMTERVQLSDELFVAAYPYFNVNEILAVEELYRDSAQPSGRPLIVFNGELDRVRSGYYPSFFYPKLGKLAKTFLPEFESAFYLHNFKGRRAGKLFRVYPGPWQVLTGVTEDVLTCIHTQETMPSLKEVALDILV